MRLLFAEKFNKQYTKATNQIKRAFLKQVELLKTDFRHPSLQAKLYDASQGIYQGRVTQSWRFYFTIDGDTYTIVAMTKHPK